MLLYPVHKVLTLNFTVVPGCCAAENPEPPNREVAPPKGLEAVLVAPNSPPLLVLVPKPEGHKVKKTFIRSTKQCDNSTEQSGNKSVVTEHRLSRQTYFKQKDVAFCCFILYYTLLIL